MEKTTAINYFGNNQDFYPTPARIIHKMLDGLKLDKIKEILEPSAGKGDIADALQNKIKSHTNCYGGRANISIDTIEIDANLRHILKGKDYKVIHDDFLKVETAKRYDLIVMNPPFSRGEWHLLKALEMMQNGGKIICLLNAETIRNPFSNPRRDLVQNLKSYDAEIEYISGAFDDADTERQTKVEIALVKVIIPEVKRESQFFSELKLKSDEVYRTKERKQEIAHSDYFENMVERYNLEVKAGIRLIEEWAAMTPHILDSMGEHARPIIQLKVEDSSGGDNIIVGYIKKIRHKYWADLFSSEKFTSRCTSNLRSELYNRINKMVNYDFSLYNIEQIKIELIHGMTQAVEDTIIKLFDDLSNKHNYSDYSKNIHYYNGWKTNKSWIINKRVIIPMYNAFSSYSGKPDFSSYSTCEKLSDIQQALDYLDQGETTAWGSLASILQQAEKTGQTTKIETKYFRISFYKKGTCHLNVIKLRKQNNGKDSEIDKQ